MVQIVTVYRTKIFKTESFKQHAGSDEGLKGIFGPFCN
jgi:hypothetical protein